MTRSSRMDLLRRSWGKLKRIHPLPIELDRIERIRARSLDELRDPVEVRALILELGLNDDGIEEMPAFLHPHCGQGLRIWQYPDQFHRYLVALSALRIGSYLELGVRHGGTFVATVEYLARFHPIERAVGIDIMPCPALVEYARRNPAARFERLNTQSPAFDAFLAGEEPFDLVLVDANHDEAECRREFEAVRDRAAVVVLHDIDNVDFPGVRRVWGEIVGSGDYDCTEFVEQYEGIGPHMGLGLAVSRGRRPSTEARS